MDALEQERRCHRDLKRKFVDLEDRYGEKCNMARAQLRRADNLAADMDECMAKRKAAEKEIKRLKEKLSDAREMYEGERRSKEKAVRDAEDEIAQQKSTEKQLNLSLITKDDEIQKLKDQLKLENEAEIRTKDDVINQLKEKPAMVESVVQTEGIPDEKKPGAASSAQGQKRSSITLPHMAAIFRKCMSTKQLLSPHYQNNVIKERRAFMQHFLIDADHEKTVRIHIGRDILELRKDILSLKEQKSKIARLTK
ncbi:hypothetical protein AAVH_00458 [Aphelenchoides avenae]|nr:hypothetical protein AAVH_00458 [Aphelenchus avenae]